MNEVYLLTENRRKLAVTIDVFSKFDITLKQIKPNDCATASKIIKKLINQFIPYISHQS